MLKPSVARLLVVPLVAVVALAWARPQEKPFNYVPPKGYVPDAATAVRVGQAVLEPVYGKSVIAREEPLEATLKNGVWTVLGNTHAPKGHFVGGVAEVYISKRTGAILRMLHGK